MYTITLADLVYLSPAHACGFAMNKRVAFAEDRLYALVLDASEPTMVLDHFITRFAPSPN